MNFFGVEVVAEKGIVKNLDQEPVIRSYQADCSPTATYKITNPHEEAALYLIIVNEDLNNGFLKPECIFLNSKNTQIFQFIDSITITFDSAFKLNDKKYIKNLINDFKKVESVHQGYELKGIAHSSIVAEIAFHIEHHLKSIGYLD